jgi:hypothetical protein
MVREIELTKGMVTIVDDDMFDMLNCLKWYYHLDPKRPQSAGYAVRGVSKSERESGLPHTMSMQKVIARILDWEFFEEVDHLDGNGLNNTRANLKKESLWGNSVNRQTQINNTSGYPGVSFDKQTRKWRVQMRHKGSRKSLGRYSDIRHAVWRYNRASLVRGRPIRAMGRLTDEDLETGRL